MICEDIFVGKLCLADIVCRCRSISPNLISPNRSPSWVYCRARTEIELGLGLGLG